MQQEIKENPRAAHSGESITLSLPVNGALFAITLIVLQNLLGSGHLDLWQTISLCLFALALPCFGVFSWLLLHIRVYKVDPQLQTKAYLWLQYTGFLAFLAGLTIIILHTSVIAGVIFLFASCVALDIGDQTIRHIENIHKQIQIEQEEEQHDEKDGE